MGNEQYLLTTRKKHKFMEVIQNPSGKFRVKIIKRTIYDEPDIVYFFDVSVKGSISKLLPQRKTKRT